MQTMNRKIRMGMIGGGPGAFIGEIHRKAANLDGLIELVCGCFSTTPEKSMQKGRELMLPEERIYASYKEMIEQESHLPQEERMDFVSIVTPNYLHFAPAKLALENGFDVVIEKPVTTSLKEAQTLEKLVEQSEKELCLTHTYTGYPMVKQTKQLITEGKLGEIRKIYVEYPQGWLSEAEEEKGNKQAAWRLDPQKGGIAGTMGDVGVHASNLVEYVSGLKITEVCADINTVIENRQLDDDGSVLLRFNNGASGVLMASQVLTGEENDLKVRIYGDQAGVEWTHSDPNSLVFKGLDQPVKTLRTGGPETGALAAHNQRTPAGHPEGFIEAFANLYRNFALTLSARNTGEEPKPEWCDFPKAEDGVREMLFLEKVIASRKSEQKWIKL